MADALQARYRGQIRYVVNRVVFNHWHHGRELSKGVPPPPGKRGNYYIGTEYCDWFERHILPQWKHNTDAQGVLLPDLTAKAQEAEAATKILNHQMAEHEWAVQQGKYILKERALNLVHGSVTVMRNLFRRAHETNIPLALAEWVKPKLSAEDWVAFREYHLAQERAAVDWLEGELERLGREGAQQVKREQN
jgi:hypothetical protein